MNASELGKICEPNLFERPKKLDNLLREFNVLPSLEKTPTKTQLLKLSQFDYKLLGQLSKKCIDSNSLKFNSTELLDTFNQHLKSANPANDFESLSPKVNSLINRLRGKEMEAPILAFINKTSRKFHFHNSDRIQQHNHNDSFVIRGRVDGIDTRKSCIIEIKSRGDFARVLKKSTIKHYDRVQCMSYMKLFNAEYCLLVECGTNGKHEIKQTLMKFDRDEFDEYMKRVERFLQFLNSFKYVNFMSQIKS